MLRTLTGSLWFVTAGALLGLLFADPLLALLGAVLGMVTWLAWTAVGGGPVRIAPAVTVVAERDTLLCVPNGHVAHCTFQRDADSGGYLDVTCCDLQHPADAVACEKQCLRLMNDVVQAVPQAWTT